MNRRFGLLTEQEAHESRAARRPEGSRVMEDNEDGFVFGDDERDAPTWRELWDENKRLVFGSLIGTTIGLLICLALTALGIV